MKCTLLKALLAVVLLFAAANVAVSWLNGFFWRGPTRFTVSNASGVELAEAHVVLRPTDSRDALDTMLPGLGAGSMAIITQPFLDSEAVIEFLIAGSLRRFQTGYIDLGSGEGWILEIQPDGSVKQGYDYPGFTLD